MQKLAEAVVHWVAYRSCLGFGRFLNESAFKEPIIGYLQSDGWALETEQDYYTVCSTVKKGKCFSDYCLSKNDQRLLLETKFFKTSSQKTVFNDFVKLALPVNGVIKCCELIVWSGATQPWGQFELLLKMNTGDKIILDPNHSLVRGGDKLFPLKDNVKEFERLRGFGQPMSTIDLVCSQKYESNPYGGMVIIVSRSSYKSSVVES